MNSTLSIETLKEAIQIKEEIQQLEVRLNQILGGKVATSTAPVTPVPAKKGPTKMSAAARKKISIAAKARWAVIKGKSPAPAKFVAKAPKKKGGLTPEGRARLAALMKARWAARKKGAAALNARTR